MKSFTFYYRWMLKVIAQIPFIPKKYFCSVCNKKSIFFRSVGRDYISLSKLNIIGGGRRKNVKCPICGSIDRDRWIDYVMAHFTDIYSNPENKILHFVPESGIEQKIRSICKGYITADVRSGIADQIVDITNIKFENNTFDYIIANHVLEHIKDEKRAIEEILRCLKPNGKAIISFPVSKTLLTKEECEPLSKKQRVEQFGQEDHCRIYGYDVIEHFIELGVNIIEYNINSYLTEQVIAKYHYLPEDRIFFIMRS